MKWFVTECFLIYKKFLSPLLPRSCRFSPTCSEFMRLAIAKNGFFVGLAQGLWRLLRCHPFQAGGIEMP